MPDPEPEPQEPETPPVDPAELTRLQARLAAAERALAFRDAGVDTSTPLGKFVVERYDGELTAEKIREFMASINPTPETPGEVQLSPEEIAASDQRQALAGSATVPGAITEEPPKDPYQIARGVYDEAMKAGVREEEAGGLYVNAIAAAAMRGDQRVTVDYNEEKRRRGFVAQPWDQQPVGTSR